VALFAGGRCDMWRVDWGAACVGGAWEWEVSGWVGGGCLGDLVECSRRKEMGERVGLFGMGFRSPSMLFMVGHQKVDIGIRVAIVKLCA